jgi:hypothetical protein
VNDALFELDPGADPRAVLVVDRDGALRAVLDARAGSRLEVVDATAITRDGLERAAVVAIASPDGATLPPGALAALAARRLLITGVLGTSFGLLAGIDHLEAVSVEELANLVESAVRHPRAFEPIRELGAVAARRHRASLVYDRLLTDLALEGAVRGLAK